MQEFMRTFSLSRFFDHREPWVLVQNGSFLNFFDYVPEHLRVGPWSVAAICYLFAIPYLAVLAWIHVWQQVSTPSTSSDQNEEMDISPFLEALSAYPKVGDPRWIYNIVIFVWMAYINIKIARASPVHYAAWSTYTVQSWTLLWIRHGLCALAPMFAWAARGAEYIRFPVACSTTITFTIWNFVLMPAIYFFAMKTPKARHGFLNFCFSFRLAQLHIFNIVFCLLNILWASPSRPLEVFDFLVAVASMLMYKFWYLGILDRVGIHFYPIFSPRHNGLVIAAWTGILLVYGGTFCAWQRLLAI
jgi:hypothetical protein